MCVDITNYPELIKVLVDVISVHCYDGNLHRFAICELNSIDRESLISAYIVDADQGEIEAVLFDADIHAGLAMAIKGRSTVISQVTIESVLQNRIYDIAQEMGPILEQIERENHEGDRINE